MYLLSRLLGLPTNRLNGCLRIAAVPTGHVKTTPLPRLHEEKELDVNFPGGKLKIRHDVRQNPSQDGGGTTFHLVFLPDGQHYFRGMEAGVFAAVDSTKPCMDYKWSVVHEYEKERGPVDQSALPLPLCMVLMMIAKNVKGNVRYHSLVDRVYSRDRKDCNVVNIAIHVPGAIKNVKAYQRNLLRKLRNWARTERECLASMF